MTSDRERPLSSATAPAAASAQPPAGDPPLLDARQLFGGRRELVILHNGAQYRLRITANDKLILTK
ncbi:hemin uptake protein HemP [Chelatococcus sp. GCM10030263]|uniref:hemin uptake protein HemP n=1 Tax=Chelatococcus sp. GCM10030263 TaxID=3273387 RepID=UPI00361CB001